MIAFNPYKTQTIFLNVSFHVHPRTNDVKTTRRYLWKQRDWALVFRPTRSTSQPIRICFVIWNLKLSDLCWSNIRTLRSTDFRFWKGTSEIICRFVKSTFFFCIKCLRLKMEVAFDVNELEGMKRGELQKLCKSVGIKANMKVCDSCTQSKDQSVVV